MKKILTFILAIIMVVAMIPAVGAAVGSDISTDTVGKVADQDAAEAACAADGYIAISTLEQWNAMTAGNYYLAEDIVVPAGQVLHTTTKIAGDFNLDGCGHTISGVNQEYALISISGNRTLSVKNIIVKNAVVNQKGSGTDYNYDEAPAILFDNLNKSYIDVDNVSVTGTLTVAEGSYANYAGILIGFSGSGKGATITNSYVSGTLTVNSGHTQAGGFIGQASGTETKFVNCISEVNVTNNFSAADENFGAGGFMGVCSKKAVLQNCVNKGKIVGNNTNAGGFIGIERAKSLSAVGVIANNCINEGEVTASLHAGGLSGRHNGITDFNAVNAFFNKGDITADRSAGGVFGYVAGSVATTEDVSLMSAITTLSLSRIMNYGTIYSKTTQNTGAFIGEAATGTNPAYVINLSIRDSGNVGRLEHGNKTVDSGALVGMLRTDGYSKVTLSNCFNAGATDTEKCTASLYNFGGYDGDVTVSDFYYLNTAGYASAANSAFVNISNAVAMDADKFASGEVAYRLGNNFGQTLGTDSYPVVGGPIVSLADDGVSYTNPILLSANDDGSAKAYIQMTEVNASTGKHNVRIILVVDEASLASVASAEMKITFKKAGAQDLSYTLTNGELRAFKSIISENKRCLVTENSAIIGAVVTDVVSDAWTSVEVEFTAKNAENTAIELLSVSGSASR
ncbi:MAG: hypothetical protein J6A83_08665 [Clostridia bacterium]|nr:hypothetical protein [Clostridia bacterium]